MFQVLPVPDLSDLPACNTMRQRAVQLSSLVKQASQIGDAATQASKAVLNNKLRKEKWFACRKPREVNQSQERLRNVWKRGAQRACFSVDVLGFGKGFYHFVISNAKK